MMMGNLSDVVSSHDASSDELVEGEDGDLYRLEIRNGKKIFTKPWHDSIKRQHQRWRERPQLTKNVFVVGAFFTSEPIAEQRLTLTEDIRNLLPRGNGVVEVACCRKFSKCRQRACQIDQSGGGVSFGCGGESTPRSVDVACAVCHQHAPSVCGGVETDRQHTKEMCEGALFHP